MLCTPYATSFLNVIELVNLVCVLLSASANMVAFGTEHEEVIEYAAAIYVFAQHPRGHCGAPDRHQGAQPVYRHRTHVAARNVCQGHRDLLVDTRAAIHRQRSIEW
eukprot:scaffold72702_cov69-Phaeocystis_antarctica.AAC.1